MNKSISESFHTHALGPPLLFFPLSPGDLQASSGHFPSNHLTPCPPDPQPGLRTASSLITSYSDPPCIYCWSYSPTRSSAQAPSLFGCLATYMNVYQAVPSPPAEKQYCGRESTSFGVHQSYVPDVSLLPSLSLSLLICGITLIPGLL